ncbi:MAG: CotH kinase family protein [Paludibacteraceae bacterium]|nr:CotH kinase family protein [Paludibacteraceae bacterium]
MVIRSNIPSLNNFVRVGIVALVCLVFTQCKFFNPPEKVSKSGGEGGNEVENNGKSADREANADYLFDSEAVPHITLTLTKKDWQTYLRNYDTNPNNRLYVPAAFTFQKGEEVYKRDSVGLRPRGNTSRVRPVEGGQQAEYLTDNQWHHAHFGIRFNKYATGKKFFGYDRIILKWHNNDPAYCREMFCYDLMHRFQVWSAPKASYCRLTISVEGDDIPVYMGVYLMVENPRKGWLEERQRKGYLQDTEGNLWKAAWGVDGDGNWSGADLSNSDIRRMGVSDDEGEKNYIYSLKSSPDRLASAQAQLKAFIDEMTPLKSGSDALSQWLEQHVDIDLFLRATAVTVATGMWDDYWCNANNYYFYIDNLNRFYFIPFDYDNTLGTGQEAFGNPGTKDPRNWGPLDGSRILMRKVMSIPAFRQQYKQYLCQLVTDMELMQPDAAIQRVQRWQEMIREFVPNDTGEDMLLSDQPARWSAYPMYRLLSGDSSDGINQESNFFKTKAKTIKELQ